MAQQRVNFAVATVALGLLLPVVARAQPIAAAGDNDQPVQIQADSGIEWQQDAHLYIARGNAVAIRGDSEVHADTLIAHYREAKHGNTGGSTEIYRVDAESHVTLKRDTRTVVGDRAVYDVDQGVAVITGKGLKLTTSVDVITARDSMEWYDQKQVAVARGDAVAIRNGKTIKADILTAYLRKEASPPPGGGAPAARPAPSPGKPESKPAKPEGKPGVTPAAAAGAKPAAESKISRVDAQGHVVVSSAIDVGRGDFGVYNADSGLATLIGNVVIERGKDVIRGQRGVMDLNNNVSRILPGNAPGVAHPRVQGLLVRQDQGAGQSGAKPGQAPGKTPPGKTPDKAP